MKTLHTLILILAFAALTGDAGRVRAQQPGDDPNWRERQNEKLQKQYQELKKELETLRKKHADAEAELEGLRNKLQIMPRSRWLDRWDSGPMFPQYRSNQFPHP
jgi:septal ring factor EnvC (AmiA/AmiB activator)